MYSKDVASGQLILTGGGKGGVVFEILLYMYKCAFCDVRSTAKSASSSTMTKNESILNYCALNI
jgi:hypothetical protein